MSKISHSSYWLNDDMWDDEDNDILSKEEVSLHRIARLASTRRAIANFVNILTNKNDIQVKFSSGKASYTTGEEVIIAADDNPDNFDTMVGLALHEASHVLLSDFTFITQVDNTRKQLSSGTDYYWCSTDIRGTLNNDNITVTKAILHPLLVKTLPTFVPSTFLTGPTKEEVKYRKIAATYLVDLLDIMNILEDRRIDAYVYRNAGGYRPYYDALYDKYFLNKEIGNSLKWNPRWRELTTENYINRLLFLIHPDSNIDSMPGLRKLVKIMDLDKIDRIAPESPKARMWDKRPTYDWTPEMWKVANELYVHILRFVALANRNKQQQQKKESKPGKGNVQGQSTGTPSSSGEPSENGSTEGQSSEENSTEPQDSQSSENEGSPSDDQILKSTDVLPNLDMPSPSQFTEKEIDKPDTTKKGKDKPVRFNEKRANKAKQIAKQVMNSTIKKKKASKNEIDAVDALEKADARMVDIKGDGVPGGQCMVTRKMSDKLLKEDFFIFGSRYDGYGSDLRRKSLAQGRRMGAILEHKLQVRNDPVHTKYTRLANGGIDKRLLANLGMDITNIFQRSRVDTFKPAMLHLTLDASGSMYGAKWEKVMVVATALAYVGTKVRNVDTVISVRGGSDIPIVSIVFDSRKDKFSSWMKWAQKLEPNGATPEGLCFKATMGLILEGATTHDVYFINFSDGEPHFYVAIDGKKRSRRNYYGSNATTSCTYAGDLAYKHTRAQMNNLKDNGVKILSYFITDDRYSRYGSSVDAFKKMYGEDAAFVNVENAHEVLKTLNKLLLAR